MAKSIGALYVDLTVKNGMSKLLTAVRQDLARFGKASIKWGTVATGALSAAMVAGSKRAITMGADLDHLSSQTGVAASSLMRIGQAYKDNGRDAKSAGKDIGKMQKNIFDAALDPNTDANDYFNELGLSAQKLLSMSPEEQFFRIGDAIKSIENPTQKAALAMGIFGKAGAGLVTVFSKTSIDDVNKSLGRMPQIMDKFSGAMERADTLMGRLPNKSDQFFTGFTAGVIGEILPLLEKINDKDFTGLGENLGTHIAIALSGLTDDRTFQVMSLKAFDAIGKIGVRLNDMLDASMESYFDVSDNRAQRMRYIGGGGPKKLSYREAFDKNMARKRELDALEPPSIFAESADIIWNQMQKETAKRREAASKIVGDGPAQDGAYPAFIPQSSTPKSTPKIELDEFMRRGLQIGGMEKKEDEEKKQTKILTKMLAKMESKLPPLNKETTF